MLKRSDSMECAACGRGGLIGSSYYQGHVAVSITINAHGHLRVLNSESSEVAICSRCVEPVFRNMLSVPDWLNRLQRRIKDRVEIAELKKTIQNHVERLQWASELLRACLPGALDSQTRDWYHTAFSSTHERYLWAKDQKRIDPRRVFDELMSFFDARAK